MKFSQGLPLKRARNRELWKYPEEWLGKTYEPECKTGSAMPYSKCIPFCGAEIEAQMPPKKASHIPVLAVDDSPAFLHTLCMFLEGDPIFKIVATARSGKDAISAVELWHPKLVLMDLQMPEMNGLQATAKLRQYFPDLCVIILTAHDFPIAREACIKHGAYGFVLKGQLGDELPALLMKAMLHCRK